MKFSPSNTRMIDEERMERGSTNKHFPVLDARVVEIQHTLAASHHDEGNK
jgi:hypothetical protein